MGKPAARVGDKVQQDAPHCHAPIHPPIPPTPQGHKGLPLPILKGVTTVLIGGKPAATLQSQSGPCILPGCIPAGPGLISKGSGKVMIGGKPAARLGDMTMHTACAAASIPGPNGTVKLGGCTSVLIG
jgi:uncharacterized Zn-binding protein involved in type VI secretion